MVLNSASGIVINAEINDMNQTPYRKGYAAKLLIIDVGIEGTELSKILSAYPSHYTGLFRPAKSRRKKSGEVPITLILKQGHYQALLNKPPKRLGAWISAGPVYSIQRHDVKLAGALAKAGFPVMAWTHQACTLNLRKPQSRPLERVRFLVQGETWTLLSQSGLTQYGGSRTPKP